MPGRGAARGRYRRWEADAVHPRPQSAARQKSHRNLEGLGLAGVEGPGAEMMSVISLFTGSERSLRTRSRTPFGRAMNERTNAYKACACVRPFENGHHAGESELQRTVRFRRPPGGPVPPR